MTISLSHAFDGRTHISKIEVCLRLGMVAFEQALAASESSVLHLSGHGWQNGIALEGENGRAQILSYEVQYTNE